MVRCSGTCLERWLAGVYRTWNTCVKLVWDLPRSTHNYFVEHVLAKDLLSVRARILVQYVSFIQRLSKSVSKEVRILKNIVTNDVRSGTGKNCLKLGQEFSLDPLKDSTGKFRQDYGLYSVPDEDNWRLPLLETLLDQRQDMAACGEDLETVSGLIESLCSS